MLYSLKITEIVYSVQGNFNPNIALMIAKELLLMFCLFTLFFCIVVAIYGALMLLKHFSYGYICKTLQQHHHHQL